MGRAGDVLSGPDTWGAVEAVASGPAFGMGGAGDADRGVEAGTGVLGGYGVLFGSAMFASAGEVSNW